jgi:hypothetical protein
VREVCHARSRRDPVGSEAHRRSTVMKCLTVWRPWDYALLHGKDGREPHLAPACVDDRSKVRSARRSEVRL